MAQAPSCRRLAGCTAARTVRRGWFGQEGIRSPGDRPASSDGRAVAIVGTGDYDGDGKADLPWRNTDTGDDYLFMMNGLNVTSKGYLPNVPTGWAVVQ